MAKNRDNSPLFLKRVSDSGYEILNVDVVFEVSSDENLKKLRRIILEDLEIGDCYQFLYKNIPMTSAQEEKY